MNLSTHDCIQGPNASRQGVHLITRGYTFEG